MQKDLGGRLVYPEDIVLLPCRVKMMHATNDTCDLSLETIASEQMLGQTLPGTINITQVLRANPGDPVTLPALVEASRAVPG